MMIFMMKLRSVFIRVDSSDVIGTGHVMRCLVLAKELTKSDCMVSFICRNHHGNLIALIKAKGFLVYTLESKQPIDTHYESWIGDDWQSDACETINILTKNDADIIIVDHYGIDQRWQNKVKAAVNKLIVIDDLANRAHVCDLLVDQNIWPDQLDRYQKLVPKNCRCLLGPKYALLRSDFASYRAQKIKKEQRVVAFFGGGDPTGECVKLLSAALDMPPLPFDLIIVHGSSVISKELRDLAALRNELIIADRLPNYDLVLASAKYAFGASGSSNWERFCLGTPTSLVCVADNQSRLAAYLKDLQLVRYLGDGRALTKYTYQLELQWLIDNWPDIQPQNKIKVDGYGASRVANIICGNSK
ncbi:MAG: UDP-2,4-diacetamido-2,4,6-trideoxy-beta-L-altropyranose hydrolase [Enterovibrio sp.]